MADLWAVALMGLGGLLVGGTYALWRASTVLAVLLAVCAALAVASGVLRLGSL